jgi:hypothetical protein
MNYSDNKSVFAEFYQQDIASEAILSTVSNSLKSQEYRS